MEEIIKLLSGLVAGGSIAAVISLLIAALAFLLYERTQILKSLAQSLQQTLDAKEEEKKVILEILGKYHHGNLTVVQAINEIRLVLAAIQSRIE